ncbi:hypothetical protein [Breoghania sp. L-A4]|uniref:hypothetical protein n=1 Tax=Breoghania sp. L-A4 TaxID=2304600 RepID=UPI0013C303ED|nr:hypothetical protein [Breoghania sp. L-A4]
MEDEKEINYNFFVVVIIISLPFAIQIALNNWLLHVFSRQLDIFLSKNIEHYEIITGDSSIYVGGNGEMCGYRAAAVIFASTPDKYFPNIATNFEKYHFSPVHEGGSSPKREMYKVGVYYLFIITSGPYSANLDVRCW